MSPVATAPASQAQRRRPEHVEGAPLIPFTAAAHEHTEPAFTAVVTPGAGAQVLGPFDVPAFGYLRHLFLEVSGAGGALGGGALAADYPWNIFQSIALYDVNGAPIFGPIDGYAALWANILGGYAYSQDPRRAPAYVSTINTVFFLRIPVEITHYDGMGSLANQNAAAAYKVQLTINPLATIVVGGAPTAPTLTIRGWLEAWTLPNEVDVVGRPQAQTPPAHGTTQYWSHFQKSVVSGNNVVLLPRVGNLIRNIIFIGRDGTGARVDTVFPDPLTLQWDARVIKQESVRYRAQAMYEQIENLSARDTGVLAFSFHHSQQGRAGDGPPNLWLPTVQSTRLELDGVNSAAGTIQVLTNDIAPVEVLPSERFVETSASGFHPQVGVSNPSVQ